MKLAFWRRATTGDQEKIARSAAAAHDAPSGRSALREIFRRGGDTPDWAALEEHLLTADTGSTTARALIAATREQGGDATALRRAAADLLRLSPIEEAAALSEPGVILLVGVNGAGKTTSAAKLAARARAAGGSPLLVAADTFRAAAIEQLRQLAEREGVPIIEGRAGGDPAAAIHDGLTAAAARTLTPIIVDTAGRMQTRASLMDELAKMRRVIARLAPELTVEVLLVLDATAGQNGLAQARGFDAAAGISGVILTKMDAGARGGIALAIRRELGLPIRWIGVGEGSADLLPFDADAFVGGLLPPEER